MEKPICRYFGLLLCALLGGLSQCALASIVPTHLVGSYSLTMESSPVGSPFAQGYDVDLTISVEGNLCGEGLLITSPFTKPDTPSRIYWLNTNTGFEFSVAIAAPFSGIKVTNLSGTNYGTFTGEPAAQFDFSCDPVQNFFAQAESKFPGLFPSGPLVLTQINDVTFTRYYSAANTKLVVENGRASVSGGEYGASPVSLGLVNTLISNDLSSFVLPSSSAPVFDDYFVSTYNLIFGEETSFSPVASGTNATFVITADKRLCAGETVLTTPQYLAGTDEVVWRNDEAGYYFSLKLQEFSDREASIQNGKIYMYAAGGQLYGSFSGERSELSAECYEASGGNPDLSEINLMFDLAEQRLPELFPGGAQTFNQKIDGFVQRYYKGSDLTVRVKNRLVEAKGGDFGAQYINLGTLNEIIGQLQNQVISVVLPSNLSGTYSAVFSPSGAFSTIESGTTVDLAFTTGGQLCLDGYVYSNPSQDIENPELIRWKNNNTGYEFTIDLGTVNDSTITIDTTTLDGQSLGSFSATRNLLLAECAGVLGSDIAIEKVNNLIGLAEQYFSDFFPVSPLTYNQFDGTELYRYYPESSVLLAVSGNSVKVSGGAFGSEPQSLGSIESVTEKILSSNAVKKESEQAAAISKARLSVVGTLLYSLRSLPALPRQVKITEENIDMPQDSSESNLTALVKQVLASELGGTSSYIFEIIEDSESVLSFNVFINNQHNIAGSSIAREYSLVFEFTRNET